MYWNLNDKERFFKAIELADSPEMREKLLSELLTKRELESCITRLKAMFLLNDGPTWKQIEKSTGHSSKTLSWLSKIIRDKESGFYFVLRKFKKLGPSYFD
jgi:uncharacterized protein YerC